MRRRNRPNEKRGGGVETPIKFDEYEVNLDLLFKDINKERIKEPEEMFLSELWDDKHKISGRYDPRQISSMIIEGHKRIIDPLYCIIFTLISLTFLLSDKLVLQSALKKISIISPCTISPVSLPFRNFVLGVNSFFFLKSE